MYRVGRREAARSGASARSLTDVPHRSWRSRRGDSRREGVGPVVQRWRGGGRDRDGPLAAVRVVGWPCRRGCRSGVINIRGEEITDTPLSSCHQPTGPTRLGHRLGQRLGCSLRWRLGWRLRVDGIPGWWGRLHYTSLVLGNPPSNLRTLQFAEVDASRAVAEGFLAAAAS